MIPGQEVLADARTDVRGIVRAHPMIAVHDDNRVLHIRGLLGQGEKTAERIISEAQSIVFSIGPKARGVQYRLADGFDLEIPMMGRNRIRTMEACGLHKSQ